MSMEAGKKSQVSLMDTPTIFESFYIGYCRRLSKLLNYSNTRKQPPRPNAEISVRMGVLSWKLPNNCSLIFEKGFLENRYLFGS